MSIKRQTKEKYQKIVDSFMNLFTEANDCQMENIQWDEFVRFTINIAERKGFARSYKNLIKYALISEIPAEGPGAQRAHMMLKFWNPKKNRHQNTEENTVEYTPQDKKRRARRMIPEKDWEAIHYALIGRSIHKMRAQAMLSAGIGCGARPSEWVRAELVGENTIRIYSAKVKSVEHFRKIKPGIFTEDDPSLDESEIIDEQSYDGPIDHAMETIFEERILRSGLDEEKDKGIIETLRQNRRRAGTDIFRDVVFDERFAFAINLNLKYIDEFFRGKFGDGWRSSVDPEDLEKVFWKEYLEGVRKYIWRACKKVFGDEKRYSLYDTRSTFAANRKASAGIAQATADLGHVSNTVTRENYAPAKLAWEYAKDLKKAKTN